MQALRERLVGPLPVGSRLTVSYFLCPADYIPFPQALGPGFCPSRFNILVLPHEEHGRNTITSIVDTRFPVISEKLRMVPSMAGSISECGLYLTGGYIKRLSTIGPKMLAPFFSLRSTVSSSLYAYISAGYLLPCTPPPQVVIFPHILTESAKRPLGQNASILTPALID